MSSEFGKQLKISIFGQSHGAAIGVLIDGLPAGEPVDLERLQAFLDRRAPGRSPYTTSRREGDRPEILSGLLEGKTCGAPLCAIIRNQDVKSTSYDLFRDQPRPGHADYTAFVKYAGQNDPRGGGHFSGRLTAPLCFAGGICLQILERRNIVVGAHIGRIGTVDDPPFDPVNVTMEQLQAPAQRDFPVNDQAAGERMKQVILEAAAQKDSIGGIVECCAIGVPTGLGGPIFDGVENRLAAAVFGIPAVKGVEFGAGFAVSQMLGSENNDCYALVNGQIRTKTNHHGGSLGGITSGMPIVFRAALKPTPSIGKAQHTIKLSALSEAVLQIEGRHDPCILPRVVPCVEAVTAAVILDMLIEQEKSHGIE